MILLGEPSRIGMKRSESDFNANGLKTGNFKAVEKSDP